MNIACVSDKTSLFGFVCPYVWVPCCSLSYVSSETIRLIVKKERKRSLIATRSAPAHNRRLYINAVLSLNCRRLRSYKHCTHERMLFLLQSFAFFGSMGRKSIGKQMPACWKLILMRSQTDQMHIYVGPFCF